MLLILGLLFGSFLNVLALRHNSGLSILGRSRCSRCNRTLGPIELVPVLSFLWLKGRCRNCHAKISVQYPLVELATAIVFVTVFNPLSGMLLNILSLVIFSLYIAIVIYDFRHKIIPDRFVFPAIVLSIVFRMIVGGEVLDYWAGPLLALFFAFIWFVSKGRAMGFGDAKLVLSVGALLGASMGFSAIILSFWIGALYGVGIIAYSRFSALWKRIKGIKISESGQITLKSEVPFAPFIILGAWLALVWELDLLHVSIF